MGVSYEEPKYPVVDPDPSFSRIVGNFRGEDYQKIAGTTILSLPFGYFAGTSRMPMMRWPSMGMAGTIGLLGGFFIAYQASGCRLLGRIPNDQEVRESRKL